MILTGSTVTLLADGGADDRDLDDGEEGLAPELLVALDIWIYVAS